MTNRQFTKVHIQHFRDWLSQEEKSEATIEKYIRDVRAFSAYIQDQAVHKELVVQYKKYLLEKEYAVRSINSMLASIHNFFIIWDGKNVRSKVSAPSGKSTVRKKNSLQKRVSPIIISIQE